jgi:hypothetical protein
VVAVLVIGALPAVSAHPGTAGAAPEASLQVMIVVAPPTVTVGTQFNVSAQVSGGIGPFTYVWSDVPSGCTAQPLPWWLCTLDGPGNYSVSVTVTNGTGARGSATQGFTVTSNGGSGNGGGNGNGNGNQGNSNNNNNNNGSNGFNLSSLGPFLFYGLVAGIIVFALLVALTVGVILIAVTLRRRLPPPPKGGRVCSACQSTAPADAKFCPACAAPLGVTKK